MSVPTRNLVWGYDTVAAKGISLNESDGDDNRNRDRDYDRDLGVIEAITIVTRSCPNGGVIAAAEQALKAISAGGPDVLREQAYFVIVAIQGWRGERARQVHRSLSRYIEEGAAKADSAH